MELKTIIFIGRSGSGKGTQANLVLDYVHKNFPNDQICNTEMGECFRAFEKEDNYSSKLAKKLLDDGKRAPDFLAVYMWSTSFVRNLEGDEHLIIDGTPRSLPEARMLTTAFDFYNRGVEVVYLNVGHDWAVERLKERGRADDIEKKDVNERMRWFDEDVLPAVDYYKKSARYTFLDINGELPIEDVHKSIIEKLFR